MSRIRWGTSSFSEKSWVGPFYPPGTKPKDFLPFYATQFDTVEVDATYYAVPDERVVDGWARKLPDGFVLSSKFPRSIVHGGENWQPNPDAVLVSDQAKGETELFLERIARLGKKRGPLVLQFPWFSRRAPLAFHDFTDRLDAYLGALPSGFRYAVEVRNRAWVDQPLLDLLRSHRTALVLSEIKNMPHPADLVARLDVVTSDFVYGRLIGDRQATERASKTFEKIVLDKDESLVRWATMLKGSFGSTEETYVYANNHYAGHGPGTIRRLAELTEG